MTTDIAAWSTRLERGLGLLLLRGFPIDVLFDAEVELAYVGLGTHLGRPVGQNVGGDLLTHIRDDGSLRTTRRCGCTAPESVRISTPMAPTSSAWWACTEPAAGARAASRVRARCTTRSCAGGPNMTCEEFDEVIAVNLRGTWSVSRHAMRAMREQGRGQLLQVISGSAFVGSVGQTNYAASKAGVMGMLYAWDGELRRFGIRTNALWPVAETDMTQVVFDGIRRRAEDRGTEPPTPRSIGFGDPADIAGVVVYLCSPAADHLRSQLVTFNGSKLALWQHPRETWVRRQPQWTYDELADALGGADEPVYVPEM